MLHYFILNGAVVSVLAVVFDLAVYIGVFWEDFTGKELFGQ